ncbi:MAG: Asp-tRNA(Asn)/Glu-tRNA(Gln) amidotransferase subunit GatA [Cyclobacteriaceae bacterium]|nr:Asp-tRNA(Asn)/Glu-tRNA(Gln) amidotransferase subunit GatA [Cyclobacteriaceae bacterium]
MKEVSSGSYPRFSDLQSLLHQNKTSCLDRVRHHLSVIKSKSHLNVFLSVYEKDALKKAEEVDQKIKDGKAGKLAGLVVGLKDVFSYKDHPLQASSRILDGFIAQYNATIVQRLIDEDAIIIGRQNCDEFAMGSSNENSAFGPTLNAVDETRVPGGSSGASAVAVLTDMCQVSIGSDTGGSVRQPAAFCGVLGLKPTYSRVSRYGLIAYGSSFDCVGIFGRSTEDLALVLEVIAGKDEFDSTVSSKEVPEYTSLLSQTSGDKKYRIAYLNESIQSDAIQSDIKTTLSSVISDLTQAGHEVEGIDFPLMEYALPAYYILATAEASSNLSRFDGVRYGYRSDNTHDLASLYRKSRAEGFGQEVKRRILLGTFVLSASYYDAYYNQAQKVRRMIKEQTKKLFNSFDFLIMPTAPTTAFKLGEHSEDPVEMYLADLFSVHANVAGVPAMSVPLGNDPDGLPIGLQVVANDFEEASLFQFSKLLMNLRG